MRFYTKRHKHHCGIDLHARTMYVCVLDENGNVLLQRNIPTDPAVFRQLIAPFREDLVVSAECVFCWYWLADFCAAEGIAFVLGHALYMRAIHGAKAKNDRIDAFKIASLLRGGEAAQVPGRPRLQPRGAALADPRRHPVVHRSPDLGGQLAGRRGDRGGVGGRVQRERRADRLGKQWLHRIAILLRSTSMKFGPARTAPAVRFLAHAAGHELAHVDHLGVLPVEREVGEHRAALAHPPREASERLGLGVSRQRDV